MKGIGSRRSQTGATLFVGLMMLVLITLMLITTFTLSTTNLRVVGNMQFREQAIAAANAAVEERIGLTQSDVAASALTGQTSHAIDIDRDGTADYAVSVSMECIKAKLDVAVPRSSLSLPVGISEEGTWDTTWDVRAAVTDARTEASIVMNSGILIHLRDTVKKAACD